MSMQGSAMMYVTLPSLARWVCQLFDKSWGPLHERRLRDDSVESGRVGPLQAGAVGVVREAEDRDVRPLVDDLLRLDARDVGDHEIRLVDAVARDQAMSRQKPLELAAEVQIDPDEQDRRHKATLAPPTDADNRAAMGLERGLELIRAGEYFEAHEELEDEWREAPAEERDFLQGLVHVAVAWYHAGRENRPGCERQLEKAARRLASYAPAHRGVDITAALRGVEEAQKTVASGSLTLRHPPV
jgi:hypothetical protein